MGDDDQPPQYFYNTQLAYFGEQQGDGGRGQEDDERLAREDEQLSSLNEIVGHKWFFPPIDNSITASSLIDSHEEELEDRHNKLEFIKKCLPYFRPICKDRSIFKMNESTNCLRFDYKYLKNEVFQPEDELDKNLRDRPQFVLDCIGATIYHILYGRDVNMRLTGNGAGDEIDEYGDEFITREHKKINIRIYNIGQILQLAKLKSNLIGKFVSIKGTVIRVSNVRPLVQSMKYSCVTCSKQILRYFEDGRIRAPTRCTTFNCGGRIFEPIRSSAITSDWQRIRIQEESDTRDPKGGVPKTAECELTQDLVETVVPGDIVTICGIIKKIDDGSQQQTSNKTIFFVYIDVNSIDCNKHLEQGTKGDAVSFSNKDLYGIVEIAKQENVFKLIVNSICPSIYGHEMVKAGLTLALFGGNARNTNSRQKLSIRGDPHVLIVGDPGLGKSQMLKAFQNISPRGVYVSGGYTTRTGLTVSLHREAGSGDFALEAGALVLGDQGCCCIDEFDKMPKEHPALLEAMEQQSVSIAKAGIVCNLPARTSVIAAANPIGGHYNRQKTVSDNIKMSAPLLSRFDLIFILLDKPNIEMDSMISSHIMDLHSVSDPSSKGKRKSNSSQQSNFSQQSKLSSDGRQALLSRLRVDENDQDMEPLSTVVLRKYLSYAKKYVTPVLTREAAEVIQKFYLELRQRASKQDSAPVTTRQLESMIRLSEARAKLELREEVTKEDALDVIDIMKESLLETFEDEYGKVDFKKTRGMSNSAMAKRYFDAILADSKRRGAKEFSKNDMFMAVRDKGLPTDNFDTIIDTLNVQAMLLLAGGSKYRIVI